jgi:leucyl-tRNA synthetase
MAFNTAISQLMVCTNEFVNAVPRPIEALHVLLKLLSPMAPHLSDELWSILATRFSAFQGTASTQTWPTFDPAILEVEEIEMIVQVNGKLRDKVKVSKTISESNLLSHITALPKVAETLTGKTVIKSIVVPGKLVNLVVK